MEIAFGDFIEIMANITLILVAIFGVLSVVMSNVLRFFRAKDFGIDFKLTYINPSDYFASFFTVIVLLGMGVVFPHIFVWIFNSFFEAEHGTVWIGLVISSILTSMTVFLFMFITRYGFKKTYFFVLPLCLSHIMKMFYHLFLIGGTNTCQTLMQALNIASYIWTAFIFLYCAAEIIFSQGIESHVFKMKRTMKIVLINQSPHLISVQHNPTDWILIPCKELDDGKLKFDSSKYIIRNLKDLGNIEKKTYEKVQSVKST